MGDPPSIDDRVDRISEILDRERFKPPEWVDAHDLADEPQPDREWVIPDLIERQGRILLAGAEGCGKSLLALTLAAQAAAGKPVLECFPMSVGARVLYIDLEMGRSSTRSRVRQLRISCGPSLQKGALEMLLLPDGLDTASGHVELELLQRIDALQPDLVVLDPLYKLTLTDGYEREIRPALKFLDTLRADIGCALILVHHLRKRAQGEQTRGKDSSDVFGSSVLLRWPESVLLMNEENVRVVKDRDQTFGELRMFPVKRGGVWPISFGQPAYGLTEEVFDYVEVFGPCSANAVRRGLARRGKDVWDALRGLEQSSRVVVKSDKWEVVGVGSRNGSGTGP